MNSYRKILISVILLAVLASGCSNQANPLPTPTMGPVDMIKAYEDAVNRHDVPGVIAWLTEDVSFSDTVAGWESTPLQDVQKMHEFMLAIPIEVHYTDCQTSADTVTCKMTFADACTRAFRTNPIPGEAVFKIVKDKIKIIQWTPDSAALKKYNDDSAIFSSWFEKTYPDEYKWSDENWITKENGALLGKRFQEYGATLN